MERLSLALQLSVFVYIDVIKSRVNSSMILRLLHAAKRYLDYKKQNLFSTTNATNLFLPYLELVMCQF